jgi:hypothetical protein
MVDPMVLPTFGVIPSSNPWLKKSPAPSSPEILWFDLSEARGNYANLRYHETNKLL